MKCSYLYDFLIFFGVPCIDFICFCRVFVSTKKYKSEFTSVHIIDFSNKLACKDGYNPKFKSQMQYDVIKYRFFKRKEVLLTSTQTLWFIKSIRNLNRYLNQNKLIYFLKNIEIIQDIHEVKVSFFKQMRIITRS